MLILARNILLYSQSCSQNLGESSVITIEHTSHLNQCCQNNPAVSLLALQELSVMDDTVLQTHRVNPRLVQVMLLANGMQSCFLVVKLEKGDLLLKNYIMYIIFRVYHSNFIKIIRTLQRLLCLQSDAYFENKKGLKCKQGQLMHVL